MLNAQHPRRLGRTDPSSFAVPEEVRLSHIDLDWTVQFERRSVYATATYTFVLQVQSIEHIFLDVHNIHVVAVSLNNVDFPLSRDLLFRVSDEVTGLGAKLTIEFPCEITNDFELVIVYETSERPAALQWLSPEQTCGKRFPFVFSQCRSIFARSLIPCQDTPHVKFTYSAKVHHPIELTALMSAVRTGTMNGITYFEQSVPIPSYMLAIAVGALESRSLGPISKVWAEASMLDAAAFEFADTPKMLQIATDICGDYVWKQYDLLVMPVSFPYGGMENPCLTFVTPTLLAGDRSLATVVAHEISHSWTGNLITNSNFEHFWLNEGFTMFLEGKIAGRLEGNAARDFQAILGLSDLREDINNQLRDTPELTKLVVDLSGPVNPEDSFSRVPYMKGQTFVRYLEDLLGGPSDFEPFFRFYIDKFKFQSIVTADFQSTLISYFEFNKSNELSEIDWELWLYGEGMPPIIPDYDTSLADIAHAHSELWSNGDLSLIRESNLHQQQLTTLQKIEFLANLVACDSIRALSRDWVLLLETNYEFGRQHNRNAEIRCRMVQLYVKARLSERMEEILEFANSNFRMKYMRPIYRDLASWTEGKPAAVANFKRVRNEMMTVCAKQVAKELGGATIIGD